MRKSSPILLSVAALLIVSLACAAPAVSAPTQDLNILGTMVMQTMVSGATQTAQAVIPVDLATQSPVFTATLFPATVTETPTATLSPMPIFTATPVVPQISVSLATNCRTGPGKVYDRVGALLVGQVAEVMGRNATGNYWYVRIPSGALCWLWGEYATVTGNFAALPVFTPPPTPTPMPAFEAEYDGLEICSGSAWVDIELFNTGGISFESVALTVRDTDTDVVVTMSSDTFTNLNGCSDSSSRDTLDPGESPNITSPSFVYDPSDHELRATITLCSREGLNGTCLTEVIEFEP